MIHRGNLVIGQYTRKNYSKLINVKGYLSIWGGYLSILGDIKLKNLKSVEGKLYIHSKVKVDISNLTIVGGDIWIHPRAEVKMHKKLKQLMIARGI